MMRLLAVIGIATLGLPTVVQEQTTGPSPATLAIQASGMPAAALQLRSPAFAAGGSIPLTFSDYGEKISPALEWSGAPASTQSFVLMVEDPDAAEPRPFVHWILFNLPSSSTALPEAVPPTPRLEEFGGALQGRTSRGSIGYFGPRPPRRDPAHQYHFQLFALDRMLALDPGASRQAVIAAITGHVLAAGELTASFAAPPSTP